MRRTAVRLRISLHPEFCILHYDRIARRLRRGLAATLVTSLALSCGRASPGPPAIRLSDATPATIDVTGLSSDTLRALEAARLTGEQWPTVFRVTVSTDAPPVLGTYAIDRGVVRFTPAFPLDRGRQYTVTFDPARIPGAPGGSALTASVGLRAASTPPSTVVTRIYPTGGTVPENVLRMYIEFSAPMGRRSGVEYIHLLDHHGKEIPGAVLPLDYEFWSPDHRRFTVFFDPGRVKQGILPNRQMGRALTPGQTVTLVVSPEWRDGNDLPLKEEFRRTFTVTAADEQPLDPALWRIAAPAAGSRTPVTVSFPEPLDHALLMRALAIRRNGEPVAGEAQVGTAETQWSFTPHQPWQAGPYQLLALDILEDLAGNQVGRAFEVDNFDTVDKDPDPRTVLLPFTVR